MTQRTRPALLRWVAAASLLAVVACSGGGSDDADGNDDAPAGAQSAAESDDDGSSPAGESGDEPAPESEADPDEPVEVPTIAELSTCGAADHPCSWEDAPDEVLDHSLEIGQAAIDAYVDGASLVDVAEQLADDADVVSVLVGDEALSFRVDGGLAMWILGDGATGTRSTPTAPPPAPPEQSAAPTWRTPTLRPLPQDVVGDDPEAKRALVLSPYQYQFGDTDEGAEVAALYAGARGYEGGVDFFANTDSAQELNGADQFRNWDDYDVVHVSTHGIQLCDDSGCTTILQTGTAYSSKQILIGENGGSTVVFTRFGNTQGIADDFMRNNYPGGLPDTVVVLSACETGRGVDLTNSFGDGVVFSWTEPVASDFARSSSLALHRTLIETGSTTARAHQVVGADGLDSYEKEVTPDAPVEPGQTLVLGSDGRFHPVDAAPVAGSTASTDGNGPTIEFGDRPEVAEPEGETITVTLVRRGGGDSDLRVREVAWIDHPQDGGELQPGAEVRVDIRSDADYLPVALRVEGLDPGTEADTTLRLEVDGVELDSWSASEGVPTGRWGEWLIEDDVQLLNRIVEDDEIDMKLTVDLPEGGESIDQVRPVNLTCLTGQWRLRSQDFFEQIVAATGGGQGIQIAHRSGEYTVTLNEDGTYLGRRNAWQFGTSTAQGTIVTTIDSTDPGTWSASGNQLTISDPGSPATVTLQIELNGQLQSFPGGLGDQSVGSQPISGTGTFSCADNVLTTTFQGVTATFDLITE